jgi:AcrR family transcriptional regulator
LLSAIEEQPCRPQRADARRNRERVLAAAAELFAEEGCKVQIEQVAHRAGVGVGTVCRNFPTKVDLVDAVVTQGCELLLDDARAALDEPDPGAALRRFFVRMADFQATHRALAEEMSAAIPASAVPVKQALHGAVADLMKKAQDVGAIRSDIGPGDVTMLLSAISHATALTGDPELRARHISIVLDGLRPHDASPLPGRPVHFSEIQKSTSGPLVANAQE